MSNLGSYNHSPHKQPELQHLDETPPATALQAGTDEAVNPTCTSEIIDANTIGNSNEKRRAYHYGRRETHLKHYLFTKTITMNSLCVFDDSLFS